MSAAEVNASTGTGTGTHESSSSSTSTSLPPPELPTTDKGRRICQVIKVRPERLDEYKQVSRLVSSGRQFSMVSVTIELRMHPTSMPVAPNTDASARRPRHLECSDKFPHSVQRLSRI